MASLQMKTSFVRSLRQSPFSLGRQPRICVLQQRGLATHQDATYPQVPYKKGENVGGKRFSQFDLQGKVFVVTGAASSPLLSLRADLDSSRPKLIGKQAVGAA